MSSGADDPIDFKLDLTGLTLDGRYRVESILGQGGMGTVYKARDQRLDRVVVVKVPHPRFLAEEGFRERFERETRSLLQLEHPHVVKVLDVGSHRGVPYTVLQYLPGGSLEDKIRGAGGRMTPTAVLAWLPAVAEALDFVHARGVVHRDVKPGNVLFDEMGHAFLADFGIAKALGGGESGLTQTGMTPGSPDYMAPESVRGADTMPAADQYALAALVYEALSGRLPFKGSTAIEVLMLKQTAVAPSLDLPDLPPGGSGVVRRALEREPGKRFPSCIAFADAFAGALGIAASPTRRTTATEAIPKRVLRPSGALTTMATDIAPRKAWGRNAWIALFAILLGAVILGAYLAFGRASDPGPVRRSTPTVDLPPPPPVPTTTLTPPPSVVPVEPPPPVPAPSPAPIPTPTPAPTPAPIPTPVPTPDLPAMDPEPPPVAPTPARLPPPTLVLKTLPSVPITASLKYGVNGRVTPPTSKVTVAGVVATVRDDGTFSVEAPLEKEGLNELPVVVENAEGGTRHDGMKVIRDRTPPKLTITEPAADADAPGDSVLVRGHVEDATACVVDVGSVVAVVMGRDFEARTPVEAGKTSITVTAKDAAGNLADPVLVTWKVKSKSPLDGLTSKGKNAAGADEYELDRDPSVHLVLVPAASWFMGAVAGDAEAKEGEKAARRVTLKSYLIATKEVTWAQWEKFGLATKRAVPTTPPYATGDHPVTNVTFADATAYCDWAGVRLPTEAEWERAARAGSKAFLYAWGTENPPPPMAANVLDESRRKKLKLDAKSPRFFDYDDGHPYTSPVGSFKPNGLGLYDMTGNVWEWCADGYEPDPTTLPADDPFVPAADRLKRVLRGGAFSSRPDDTRLSRRTAVVPEFTNDATGFRVARDGPR